MKNELLIKSREAMLSAVQIFNNPQIAFKSETFISLAVISWTYLLHAYYKKIGVDYRYYHFEGKRKRYDKTKHGAFKHWELEACLDNAKSPVDADTKQNLKFLIGIRHEIEHQMTNKIDESISAKLQACSINYNYFIKKLFGDDFGVDQDLGIAIQFSPIQFEQKEILMNNGKVVTNVNSFIASFESSMTDEQIESTQYAYRVLFTKLIANRKGQADQVVEFIPSDSPLAEGLNKEYRVIKETEKKKYLPSQIVDLMHTKGYIYFTMHHHTQLWKSKGMNMEQFKKTGFGTYVADKQWLWYEKWIVEVEAYCKSNEELFRFNTNTGNTEIGYLPKEITQELNKIDYMGFNAKNFTDWRIKNGIDKIPKYGMENIKGDWMWKENFLEMLKKDILNKVVN